MSTSPASSQPLKSGFHLSPLLQLILSAVVSFLLLGGAVAIVAVFAFQHFSGGTSVSNLTQPFMIAASLAFGGILVIPSAWYSWKQIAFPGSQPLPQPERRYFGLFLTIIVLILVSGAIWLGDWVSKNSHLSWLILPPLNIIATGLPTLWIVYIGTRGLIPGAPKRKWGVFAGGLVMGPLIILVLELILLIGVGIVALLWALLDPSLSNQLNGLVFRLQNSATNPDALLNLLLPFLLNPGILFIGFAFVSVLVPMLEEALKPIGVWLLAGQKITPAQGFGYGVLSGAGFGLFENLGNTSNGDQAWALLVSTRISTLLLHCCTAGLVGWALASIWSHKKYLRLIITYLIAVVVHGTWNGLAVLGAVSSLQNVSPTYIPINLQQIGVFSSAGLIALGSFVLVLFVSFNAILRRSVPAMSSPSLDQGPGHTAKPDSSPQFISQLPDSSLNIPAPILPESSRPQNSKPPSPPVQENPSLTEPKP